MKAMVMVLLLLGAGLGVAATPLPGQVSQYDNDGGRSLRLLIDDGPGGHFDHIRVDVEGSKDAIAEALRGTGNGQANLLANLIDAVNEPVNEVGVYTHAWGSDAPMLTVGVYVIHDNEGLLRAPILIFENIVSTSDLTSKLLNLLIDDATDFVLAAVAFAQEYALVESTRQMDRYPTYGQVNTFQDQPTIYVWYARKVQSGLQVWNGFYAARTGDFEGSERGIGDAAGQKRMDLGVALRTNTGTERVAGAYIETAVSRHTEANTQQAAYRLTAGAYSDRGGSVPLLTVDAEDDRFDRQGDLFGTPESQNTRFTVGTWVAGNFVPLLGTETSATHRRFSCPEQPADQPARLTNCLEQTRITSVGSFVDGQYVPLAGVRYHGERAPLLAWQGAFVAGGGPGAQNVGDFELDVGTFVDGAFVPIAGVQFDDAFADARQIYQMMLSAGIYSPLGYQPVVAVTYDGVRPLLRASNAITAGDRDEAVPWMVSMGTFAGTSYVPLLGVRYNPHADAGSREQQHQFAVGTFLANYRLFVPLAGAQWDSDLAPTNWVLAHAAGFLGQDAGDMDAGAGAFVLGHYVPLLSIRARNNYDSTEGEHAAEEHIVVGTHGPDGSFIPLVGLTYGGQSPLASSFGAPGNLGDDGAWRATVGTYVLGEFVPVLGVYHDGDATSITPAPQRY